ncbi:hypothetical protein AAKU64_004509 [Undibacterium sp. GrIS 1.8]|uniref:hypothetical protein n=1 Tax=Undibacterium sp. GrIS 1.8 TaxID=3143934 RepID=UPI003398DFB9
MINCAHQKEVFLSLELDSKSLYSVSKTVGGCKLKKLQKNDDIGLIKIKIDESVFKFLLQKKLRQETNRMAVERAILSLK